MRRLAQTVSTRHSSTWNSCASNLTSNLVPRALSALPPAPDNTLGTKLFDFMYRDAHGVAFILDPRYLGDGMSRTFRNEIEDFIRKFPVTDGTTCEARMEQLAMTRRGWTRRRWSSWRKSIRRFGLTRSTKESRIHFTLR